MIRLPRFSLYETGTEMVLLVCWKSREMVVVLWDSSAAYTGVGRWGL